MEWADRARPLLAEQSLHCRPALSASRQRLDPMVSQSDVSLLFLQRSQLALQPTVGLDRGIWLKGGMDEAALGTLVGMRNEAVFREGASDPVTDGSAIWTGLSPGTHVPTRTIAITQGHRVGRERQARLSDARR